MSDIAWTSFDFWKPQPEASDLDADNYVFPYIVPKAGESTCRKFYDFCAEFNTSQLVDFVLPGTTGGEPFSTPQQSVLDRIEQGETTFWGFDGSMNDTLGAFPQQEILRRSQSSFFISVVISRMAVVILCKTSYASLFTHGMANKVLVGGLPFTDLQALCLSFCWRLPSHTSPA